jgi:cytochrome c5
MFERPAHPAPCAPDTRLDAAYYPEAADQGKNGGRHKEVSGFSTLPSTGGRTCIYNLP